MASVVTEKLYPPIIGSSIPAFYQEGGTAVIAVPFSMNRAVSGNLISGFSLKIKTVQSNTFIKTLTSTEVENSITNKIVKFYWYNINSDREFQKIKLGQYLKLQIAYLDKNGNPGYFSTVGIIKYTSKPLVYIEGLQRDTNRIGAFRSNYTGVYVTGEDRSERPYSYNFRLYDRQKGLIEQSGWKLHNSSVDHVYAESLTLEYATDSYTFQALLEPNKEYFIDYAVRTVNNLEVSSPLYTCIEPDVADSILKTNLLAENNFEEGYIFLHLDEKDGVDYSSLSAPVSIQLCRAEKTDNFQTWVTLKKAYFDSYDEVFNWNFKDYTIEQGVIYQYCYREYNEYYVQSNRELSNQIMADFEDMFLWDGVKQLKIRFNPKVPSFKINRLESRINTIGSQYPFFFRNGVVKYREFPIGGLISYLADNNEEFLNHEEDLNIILADDARRKQTPIRKDIYHPIEITEEEYVPNQYYYISSNEYKLATFPSIHYYRKGTVFYIREMSYTDNSYETAQTLDSLGYNMRAERRFKMKLLEWLGNGKIKMFKSPAEGNFLVRLMNVSLSPEDRIGRMLHSFSATAYEVEELTYNNLVDLSLININEQTEQKFKMTTIKIKDKIKFINELGSSVKINDFDIQDTMYIGPSANTSGGFGFFVRLGGDDPDKKVFIQQQGFILESNDTRMPDVFFNILDNINLIPDLQDLIKDDAFLKTFQQRMETLVGDAVLTYGYTVKEVQTGDFDYIKDIYIRNEICSYIGPFEKDYNYSAPAGVGQLGSPPLEQVLKFFVIDFKKKTLRQLTKNGNDYYENGLKVTNFEETSLYEIYDEVAKTTSKAYFKDDTLQFVEDFDYTIELTDANNENNVFIFNEPPVLNLNEAYYSKIKCGNGFWLNCACQIKITEFKEG